MQLPLGADQGRKGYCLAVMVEVLSGILVCPGMVAKERSARNVSWYQGSMRPNGGVMACLSQMKPGGRAGKRYRNSVWRRFCLRH